MNRMYSFLIEGTASDGTWTTKGTIDAQNADIVGVVSMVLRESFGQLTQGKAVFGMPGMGCKGPYDIHKIVIEQVKQ